MSQFEQISPRNWFYAEGAKCHFTSVKPRIKLLKALVELNIPLGLSLYLTTGIRGQLLQRVEGIMIEVQVRRLQPFWLAPLSAGPRCHRSLPGCLSRWSSSLISRWGCQVEPCRAGSKASRQTSLAGPKSICSSEASVLAGEEANLWAAPLSFYSDI